MRNQILSHKKRLDKSQRLETFSNHGFQSMDTIRKYNQSSSGKTNVILWSGLRYDMDRSSGTQTFV